MSKRMLLFAMMLALAGSRAVSAQSVQVNRSNKTISVSVSEKVSAKAEFAQIEVRYSNYARTREAAFEENVRAGNKIVQALLNSGLQKEDIETKSVNLSRAEFDRDLPEQTRKDRQYEAEQVWTLRVSVADAEHLLTVAVDAGVTYIGEVQWKVAKPEELESKAQSAALNKARAKAQQMAVALGGKLGELLYVSNQAEREQFIQQFWMRREQMAPIAKGDKPFLKLFPQPVNREATIQAVFALE